MIRDKCRIIETMYVREIYFCPKIIHFGLD